MDEAQRINECIEIDNTMNFALYPTDTLIEKYEQCVKEGHIGLPGAALEISPTGFKVDGEEWFIIVVLLALPLLYVTKKFIDKKFS